MFNLLSMRLLVINKNIYFSTDVFKVPYKDFIYEGDLRR